MSDKLFFIAGEASGDLHASNLAAALLRANPELKLMGWGGELMEQEGVEIRKHYRDLAFMGFWEVVKNLKTIFKNIELCKQQISEEKPSALVLIDYPGFNLRIAKWAKEMGIPVYYYIAPQIWAWKENRVHQIKKNVTELFAVLPFEKEFYSKKGMDVHFVGHPLLDEVKKRKRLESNSFRTQFQLDDRPIVALLPGSRKQEVKRMLEVMLKLELKYPNYQFIIAGAPSLRPEFYQSLIGEQKTKLVFGVTYDLFEAAEAAMVTSGTATLEAALLNCPEVVCYKANPISYFIAKQLVKIKFISLVNLLLDREAVRELIQFEWNLNQASQELDAILNGGMKREHILASYQELRMKLGDGGASDKTAQLLLESLESITKQSAVDASVANTN
ncbi:MAG: lipid-A-disaccharide synthase [Bacteroidetes bacterium]|nr:lipid-A-disaccharide synthase [Bacteroidota bacterium]